MKKEFQGLKVEKVLYNSNEIMTDGSNCTKMVAYNDRDNTGLCDEAEYEDHEDYGNYMEYYVGPSKG